MQAGKLRTPIVILYPTESQNAMGEREVTWNTLTGAWCDFREVRSSEAFAAEQMQGKRFVRARIRYLPNLSTKMRAQDAEGRVWLIRGVAPLNGSTREIDLTLEEFTDA